MNKIFRAWGWYEVLIEGKGWKLKRLMISPKKESSFQKHSKRNELWFYPASKKFSIILESCWHQLINDLDEPLEIIELQWGEDCNESDIERR